MNRTLTICKDGTRSVRFSEFNECYHSDAGSVEESFHVYIGNGLHIHDRLVKAGIVPYNGKETVAEAGFGTGLNAFLTMVDRKWGKKAYSETVTEYYTLELYPLEKDIWHGLEFWKAEGLRKRYPDYNPDEAEYMFRRLHECAWDRMVEITDNFRISKIKADISDTEALDSVLPSGITTIYYDAFSPSSQPELWSREIFSVLFGKTSEGGTLSTYSSKGSVKENLREAGYIVKRAAGFAGKHHMVTAIRPLPGMSAFPPDVRQAF